MRNTQQTLLDLRMEAGDMSQGMQAALEAGKGEGRDFALELPEGMQAC